MQKIKRIVAYIKWLLPDSVDSTVYVAIILLTILFSNISNLQKLSIFPQNLDIKTTVLNLISDGLSKFLPDNIAASLATAIFWSFIGLIVYLLLLFAARFTSDISDDLAVDKYVYPKGTDKYSRFKHFILLNSERIVGVIIFILYIRVIFNDFLPKWAQVYHSTVVWPLSKDQFINLLLTLLAEFVALHILVILTRIILLRQRVFGL